MLVDNGSPAPISLEEIGSFPDLVIRPFKLTRNIGFAAGNNYAARQASGQYLVLLNSDAFPQPDWLAVIYGAIPGHPRARLHQN